MSRRSDRKTKASKNDLLSFFGIEPSKYDAWLLFLFDRPVTRNGWYFDWIDEPPEFDATPSEIVGLIGMTLHNSGIDLSAYSDKQVYHGLNYIFFASISDVTHLFADEAIALDRRVEAIGGIKNLYEDLLEQRCSPALGHLDEGSAVSLNGFAYMVWDTTDLWYWTRHIQEINATILSVLEFALCSPNDACVESALHGLGHEVDHCKTEIQPIIDRWLVGTRDAGEAPRALRGATPLRPVRPELRAYARAARKGMIL